MTGTAIVLREEFPYCQPQHIIINQLHHGFLSIVLDAAPLELISLQHAVTKLSNHE